MNRSTLLRAPVVRHALFGVAAALLVFITSAVRAIRLDEIPSVSTSAIEMNGLASPTERRATDLEAALAHDPFAPSRTPPGKRYTLPWEAEAEKAPEPAKPVVLGTAIALDGRSFAICQLGDDRARTVHVGDRLGPYQVRSIARGHVVFQTSSGSTLDVAALK